MRLTSILGLIIFLACQGKNSLTGNMSRTAEDSKIAQEIKLEPLDNPQVIPEEADIAEVELEMEEENMGSMESNLANEPVMVAGAFLSCRSITPGENETYECQARQENGDIFPIEGEVQVLLYEAPLQTWHRLPFASLNREAGLFTVNVSANIQKPFAIALVTKEGVLLLDWIDSDNGNLNNLVLDGSFEFQTLQAGAGSGFFTNDQLEYWQVRPGVNHNCPDNIAYMEIQQRIANVTQASFHGSQHVELDSGCTDISIPNAGNVAIYQDVSIMPKHLYFLSFYTTRRQAGNSRNQAIRVRFDAEVIYEGQTTHNNWQERKKFWLANEEQAAIRLEFSEIGRPDSLGTLLDHVRLFDLGPIEAIEALRSQAR